MSTTMVDVTLHIDEDTSHSEREELRDVLLDTDGVMSASYHEDKPHLMIIEYDPTIANSQQFVKTAKRCGLHSELIGL